MPFEPSFPVPEALYEGLVASGATSGDRVAKLSDTTGGAANLLMTGTKTFAVADSVVVGVALGIKVDHGRASFTAAATGGPLYPTVAGDMFYISADAVDLPVYIRFASNKLVHGNAVAPFNLKVDTFGSRQVVIEYDAACPAAGDRTMSYENVTNTLVANMGGAHTFSTSAKAAGGILNA